MLQKQQQQKSVRDRAKEGKVSLVEPLCSEKSIQNGMAELKSISLKILCSKFGLMFHKGLRGISQSYVCSCQ